MKTLHILVVTRNRLSALIDSLCSIKRVISLSRSSSINIEVTVQDNSGDFIPDSVINYFKKYIDIRYHKTSSVLSMSNNWNQGLLHVLERRPNYVAVLADRRLVTTNLIQALRHIESLDAPFLCFDHQDVWINATRILKRSHSYNFISFNRHQLLSAIFSARVDWHYPMLFNCIIKGYFFEQLLRKYGSYADGASPDMNFLARIADIGIKTFNTYDAPCIVTNARFAAKSNGSSSLKHGLLQQTEHTKLSGIEAYPNYMENFVTANITGSLSRYWSDHEMNSMLNVREFFKSSLVELSYPKSYQAFSVMKNSLIIFAKNYQLELNSFAAIDSIKHQPSCNQTYPLDSSDNLTNVPMLDLLTQIEYKVS